VRKRTRRIKRKKRGEVRMWTRRRGGRRGSKEKDEKGRLKRKRSRR